MSSVGKNTEGPQAAVSPDDGDTDWDAYRVTDLRFDVSALFREAELVCLRAQAAQPPALSAAPTRQGDGGDGHRHRVVAEAHGGKLTWPPGRAGRIARFIFANSYSPIPEVAITATLALLAGVCGRAYRTHTNMDLALYLIFVAKSGVGKDGIHKGIPLLLKQADHPFASRFVRSQDFVSGEALHKEVLREPGFLYLQGEFGRKLKRMSNPTDTPMQTLRTLLTNAYGKEYLEGKSYSNSENSLDGVDWPALSFLGETTPGTFLECLTPDMMADGFLSRFLIITYDGDKPYPNPGCGDAPPLCNEDATVWRSMVNQMQAFQMPIDMPPSCTVQPNADALERLTGYELECVAAVNATDDEAERQVWNRAYLKVLKVASLLAVADNWLNPIMRLEHFVWARLLVDQDIEIFQSQKQSGDIGTDDDARERKLVQIMRDYLNKPPPASYKVPEALQRAGVIPRFYLQRRVTSLPAFNNHRLGAGKAMDDALRSLAANGYVREVKENNLVRSYDFHGKAYRILKVTD